ncbi:MAG: hypothetical protein AABY68_06080 [Pseudomonadota bacterium]
MSVKKVRMLMRHEIEGVEYPVNAVVALDESLVKSLVKEGIVDSSKAAVDYCINELGARVIEHSVEDAASPAPPAPLAPSTDAGAGDDPAQGQIGV